MKFKYTHNKVSNRNVQFYRQAIRTHKKLSKKILPIKILLKKINKTSLIFADDTRQLQGSYKFRGANSEIIKIKKKKIKNVSLGSTGNFGLSVSYLCKKNKIKCNIFISEDTNISKKKKLIKNNANLYTRNKNYDEAKKNAKIFARKNKHTFIDVCSKDIFLGNASMMLEIFNQIKKIDTSFIKKKILAVLPLGSGSLATPSIKILKYLNPNIKVVVVEPSNFSKFYYDFDNSIKPNFKKSVAEGASVRKIPRLNYKYLKNNTDIVSKVSELEIKKSMHFLYRKFKIKSEGAGALPTSFILNYKKKLLDFDYIIIPICGSNIDRKNFTKIISKFKNQSSLFF